MNIERAKLTPEQEEAWNRTKTALIWHAPAFSHIFYTLLKNCPDKDSKGQPLGAIFTLDPAIPTAATGWIKPDLQLWARGLLQVQSEPEILYPRA